MEEFGRPSTNVYQCQPPPVITTSTRHHSTQASSSACSKSEKKEFSKFPMERFELENNVVLTSPAHKSTTSRKHGNLKKTGSSIFARHVGLAQNDSSSVNSEKSQVLADVKERSPTMCAAPSVTFVNTKSNVRGFPDVSHRNEGSAVHQKFPNVAHNDPPTAEIDQNLRQTISDENDLLLRQTSRQEIKEMREKIIKQLGPDVVKMIRGGQKDCRDTITASKSESTHRNVKNSETSFSTDEPPLVGLCNAGEYEADGTVKPSLVESLEREKLRWMEPVQVEPSQPKDRMDICNYRFDFDGRLLSYPSDLGNVMFEQPENSNDITMLLHHGDAPLQPGYTIEELCILSRSLQSGQRVIALGILRQIIRRAKSGSYVVPDQFKDSNETCFVNSLIITHLLESSKLVLLLRHAIDDSHRSVLSEAIQCLAELVYSECDLIVDAWSDLNPNISNRIWPLTPFNSRNLSALSVWGEIENDSNSEKSQIDLVLTLLDSSVMPRLRYIIEVIQPGEHLTIKCLHIIYRCIRHSSCAAEHLVKCPRLLNVLATLAFSSLEHDFLDCHEPPSSPESQTQASLLLESRAHLQFLALRIIRMACLGAILVTKQCYKTGIIDRAACMLFSLSPYISKTASGQLLAVETLMLIQIELSFGFFVVQTQNLLQPLLEILTGLGSTQIPKYGPLVKSKIFDIFSLLPRLSNRNGAAPTEKGDSKQEGALLNWSCVVSIYDTTLQQLKLLLERSDSLSSHEHVLLASMLNFLTAYYEENLLRLSAETLHEESRQQACATFSNLMTQSTVIARALLTLSDAETWSSTATVTKNLTNDSLVCLGSLKPSIADYKMLGPYTLSLKSHATLSCKEQLCVDFKKVFCADSTPARLPTLVSVLMHSLRFSQVVARYQIDTTQFLTNSEFSRPLCAFLEHYTRYGMQSESASYLNTRSLHHLAFYAIKAMHYGSSVAHEASVICLGRLLPGDESELLYLLERILRCFSHLECFKSSHLAHPTTAFDPVAQIRLWNTIMVVNKNVESLYMPVEGSLLPLGKNWPYMLLCRLTEGRVIPRIRMENILESLDIIVNIEDTARCFISQIDISVRLYCIMRCFMLEESIWHDDAVSELLLKLLKNLLRHGWPQLLRASIPIETHLLDRIIDIWADEHQSHPVLPQIIALWLIAGSSLNDDQIRSSGKSSELRHLDCSLWTHCEFLWNKLPQPLLPEPFYNTTWITRPALINRIIAALHCRFLIEARTAACFYYRAFIYQVSAYLFSEELPSVSNWDRQNAFRILLEYEKSSLSHNALQYLIHDIVLLTPHEQRYSDLPELSWIRIQSLSSSRKSLISQSLSDCHAFKETFPHHPLLEL